MNANDEKWPEAYRACLDNSYPIAVSIAMQHSHRREDAEDYAVQALESAFREFQKGHYKKIVDGETQELDRAWLRSVIVRKVIDAIRKRRRRPEESVDDVDPNDIGQRDPGHEAIEGALERESREARKNEVLEQLSPGDRLIYTRFEEYLKTSFVSCTHSEEVSNALKAVCVVLHKELFGEDLAPDKAVHKLNADKLAYGAYYVRRALNLVCRRLCDQSAADFPLVPPPLRGSPRAFPPSCLTDPEIFIHQLTTSHCNDERTLVKIPKRIIKEFPRPGQLVSFELFNILTKACNKFASQATPGEVIARQELAHRMLVRKESMLRGPAFEEFAREALAHEERARKVLLVEERARKEIAQGELATAYPGAIVVFKNNPSDEEEK